MLRREKLALGLFGLLALAAALLAARVARHYEEGGRLRLELGSERVTRLDPALRARFAKLPEHLRLTYYVSNRAAMASELRHVERSVTDLLSVLRRVSGGAIEVHVVDPTAQPDLPAFAARRRIAPFRVRSVSRDAWSERTVWSSLAIDYGEHAGVAIDGITPELVPRLPAMIAEHLDRLEAQRPPLVALAAPPRPDGTPGFAELAAQLAAPGPRQARVLRVDLDGGADLPASADLCFWIEPRHVTPEQLRQIDRFLDDGRSLVVAAPARVIGAADVGLEGGKPALRLRPATLGAEPLLSHLGLEAVPGLLLDEVSESASVGGEAVPAPFLVRCIAPNQDFAGWRLSPNGTLLFTAPTPLAPRPETLEERGWSARVLATSSDSTRLLDVGPGARTLSFGELAQAGEPIAKAPLVVHLLPGDPARGHVVALGAATPFEDGILHRERAANARLVDALLAELASSERLVYAHAEPARPELLPDLAAGARLGWRLACVLLGPALILVATWRRMPRVHRAPGRRERRELPLTFGLAGALAAALLVVRIAGAVPARVDLSEDGLGTLAPETRAIAARARGPLAVEARLCLSPRERFPLGMRPGLERLAPMIADLRRAGASLEVRTEDPEEETEAERAALEARDVRPQRIASRDGDVTTVRTLWASLLLSAGGREERLDFTDALSFESLEFRLAFALHRLQTGDRAVVAFASDVPRLSPAEAYELYQQKGLFAPQGTDVYAEMRRRLAELGYEVVHVNPRAPELPDGLDALVWLQPRRPVAPMLERVARYLHGGGNVLLAAQHFDMQARQYRGADFDVVYWPQPQNPDVDRFWFPELSIQLVREVVFDELATDLVGTTQIMGRGAERDLERQASALPFLVRASAASYAPGSTVTAGLGDQALPCPSYLRWDPARLAELGLRAQVLMSSSPRSWTFDWKGGWIPPALLAGPPRGADGAPLFAGPLPLAVLFAGSFPRPEAPLEPPAADGAPAATAPSQAPAGEGTTGAAAGPPAEPGPAPDAELPWPAPAPGRLLFLGASAPFQDALLADPRFRGDQLLANAVATLALPPELARLATRRRVARGFGWIDPAARLRWRVLVLAGGPAIVLVLAVGAWLARRRAA